MLIRIRKRLFLPQVVKLLRSLERKFGIPSENLGFLFDRVQRGEVSKEEYVFWARLYDAYRAYVENGELDYVYEEEIHWDAHLASSLTARRLELLSYVASEPMDSINDLARQLDRDVKNVYNDLRILSKLGLITLTPAGKSLTAQSLVDEITFVVR